MPETKIPKPLKPGATIGVIAPASAAKRKPAARGLEYLRSKGYKVVKAPYLTRGKHYLAGSDERRAKLLEEFILDDNIDAIICIRGGYGILRILDKIDFSRLKNTTPKPIVGYSDVTALQLALLRKLGWVSYSGPMVAPDLSNISDFSEKWLWDILTNPSYPLDLKNPPNKQFQIFRNGTAQGPLIGGCLSLITPLLGTQYCPSLKNAILVIEDIGEKVYRLDKLLHTLRLHDVFEEISGLIVGAMTDCFPKNPKKSFTFNDLLTSSLKGYKFPVITNFAYGHINQRFTLPWGMTARIDTAQSKILKI